MTERKFVNPARPQDTPGICPVCTGNMTALFKGAVTKDAAEYYCAKCHKSVAMSEEDYNILKGESNAR